MSIEKLDFRVLLFLNLCLVAASCSISINGFRLIDEKGEKSLLKNQIQESNYFRGSSDFVKTEKESLKQARLDAIEKIYQSLGISMEILSFRDVLTIDGKPEHLKKRILIKQKKEYFLGIDTEKSYTSKWQKNGQIYYRSHVLIKFDRNKFIRFWSFFLEEKNLALESLLRRLNSDRSFKTFLEAAKIIEKIEVKLPDRSILEGIMTYQHYQTFLLKYKNLKRKIDQEMKIRILDYKDNHYKAALKLESFSFDGIRSVNISEPVSGDIPLNRGKFLLENYLLESVYDLEFSSGNFRMRFNSIPVDFNLNKTIYIDSNFPNYRLSKKLKEELRELGYQIKKFNKTKLEDHYHLEIKQKIETVKFRENFQVKWRSISSAEIILNKNRKKRLSFIFPNSKNKNYYSISAQKQKAIEESKDFSNLINFDILLKESTKKIDEKIKRSEIRP